MTVYPTDRLPWIDLTKGVAIALVVLGHCWIGLHSAGLIPDEHLFETIRRGIYLFHMPLFFIVSGMLIYKVSRLPIWTVLTSRMMLLIYPLILWTYLMMAGKWAMGSMANDPVTLDSLNWNPLPAQWQFWFLWALFLLHLLFKLITMAAQRLDHPLTAYHWAGITCVSTALAVMTPDLGALDPYLRPTLLFAPFFFLGVCLHFRSDLPLITPIWPLLGFVAVQVIAYGLDPSTALDMMLAMYATACVMLLCRWLAEQPGLSRVLRPLIALGAASMAIYLAHTFFSAPIRAILLRLDITTLLVHVLLGTLIGIVGPWVLYRISARLGARRLLGF